MRLQMHMTTMWGWHRFRPERRLATLHPREAKMGAGLKQHREMTCLWASGFLRHRCRTDRIMVSAGVGPTGMQARLRHGVARRYKRGRGHTEGAAERAP